MKKLFLSTSALMLALSTLPAMATMNNADGFDRTTVSTDTRTNSSLRNAAEMQAERATPESVTRNGADTAMGIDPEVNSAPVVGNVGVGAGVAAGSRTTTRTNADGSVQTGTSGAVGDGFAPNSRPTDGVIPNNRAGGTTGSGAGATSTTGAGTAAGAATGNNAVGTSLPGSTAPGGSVAGNVGSGAGVASGNRAR